MFSEATQDPELFLYTSVRGLQPFLNSEHRVSWASISKITTWLWSFTHEQSDPSFIPFPPLFPVTWTAYTEVLASRHSYQFCPLQPWLVQNNTNTRFIIMLYSTPASQRVPSAWNPHGKKMLLESDIKIVSQTRTRKRKPQDRASCMEMGRV